MMGNKITTVLAIMMSSWLVGCGSGQDALMASTGVADQPLFVLSPDGVGPLNADTPFNLIRIGDAFQDFNVSEEVQFVQNDKFPVITVKDEASPVLSINPDYQHSGIFSIIVHDRRVANRLGHQLGDTYRQVYSYGKTEKCAPGVQEWAGKVMCYAPSAGNVLYLFSGGPQALVTNEVPTPDKMADWQLDAIVWRPPVRAGA